MTSQIFQTNENTKSSQVQTFCLNLWHSNTMQWFWFILLIAAVIFFPERTAWADSLDIIGF